ncbi:MAG: aldo/keto reductase, partial [Acidimicrobiales bacterium]
ISNQPQYSALHRRIEARILPTTIERGMGTVVWSPLAMGVLTGKYDNYEDVTGEFLGERFEAKAPTVFEYLRQSFAVPEHQTLIINGEDRTDEEFYTFSNHHLFGADFRSNVLSLYRYKTYLLRQQIREDAHSWSETKLDDKRRELAQMEALDYRRQGQSVQSPEIEQFWKNWRKFYGDSGLVNPRGDRLLTELALRALKQLRPKLLMINYNDCDYVHWGNMAHYTRGIAIMDVGIQRIVEAVEADQEYRENTVFVIVPDCGRDDSRFAAVPCQHHFGGRSSREIFSVIFGSGIPQGRIVDRPTEQTQIAATIGQLMGFRTSHAEGNVLEEAIA